MKIDNEEVIEYDHPEYEAQMLVVKEQEEDEERFMRGSDDEEHDGSSYIWHEKDTSEEQMAWQEEAWKLWVGLQSRMPLRASTNFPLLL